MSLKGPLEEYSPERTLFGSSMDSNKPMAKINYSDYLSGKWKDEKKDKAILELQIQFAKVVLDEQKLKANQANEAYNNSYLSALHFNGLEPNDKANKQQVEDYNNFRKFNSSFEATKVGKEKEVFQNVQSYQLNGNVLSTGNPTFRPRSATNPVLLNKQNESTYVETYKAADGTIYKHYVTPNGITKEAEYPSKNVIHIPGKYHELYRQWASPEEIPQNIRHKFGTKQTNELLKDPIKVHDTLSKIHNTGIIKKNNKSEEDELKLSKNEKELVINNYYDLGNHLRHAIGHGYPTVYTSSHIKTVHNPEVNKEHLSNLKNVESPHRRKKDWLIHWTEMNIVNDRIINDYSEKVKAEAAEKAKAGAGAT